MTLGLLHPGEMGASVGAAAAGTGRRVLWASEGRSAETQERAECAGLDDVETVDEVCHRAELIVSVCPPDKALVVAEQVVRAGFAGLFVDANAIAPSTAREVAECIRGGGADFVDGGLIGPPAWKAGSTRLYLSGERAEEVADCFARSSLDARVIEGADTAASALKMAYAGWTKGSSALLLELFAMAREEGVADALIEEWEISQPGLEGRLSRSAAMVAPKAWRFIGEMGEIATALQHAGLPAGSLEAAAETYRRLARFKNANPTLEEVISALRRDQAAR